jgi:small subunit ribosomal protein S14
MTTSSHIKILKQLKSKPAKYEKFRKHNSPIKRTCGEAQRRCRRCGSTHAHIRKYGLHLCRKCFREVAPHIGFKKYS